MMMRSTAPAFVTGLALLAGCAGDPPTPADRSAEAPAAPDRGPERGTGRESGRGSATAATPASFSAPRDLPGLHNVIEVAPGVFSGSEPQGEEAFAELRRLGVRSVLSVDGGAPDLEMAHAHDMRYAHVPIRYSEITLEQKLAIARAMDALEGPVYVHCHHGKHRGPAAAAAGLVSLGALSAADGVAFMKLAGTSSKYPGLYECVREAAPLTRAQIELVAMPGEVAEVPGFVAAMALVSRAFENLQVLEQSAWGPSAEHPDLAPASEAGQLADVLRVLTERREPAGEPDEFYEWMGANARLAQELEDAIVAGEDPQSLSARLKAIDASCAACHTVYRNE